MEAISIVHIGIDGVLADLTTYIGEDSIKMAEYAYEQDIRACSKETDSDSIDQLVEAALDNGYCECSIGTLYLTHHCVQELGKE